MKIVLPKSKCILSYNIHTISQNKWKHEDIGTKKSDGIRFFLLSAHLLKKYGKATFNSDRLHNVIIICESCLVFSCYSETLWLITPMTFQVVNDDILLNENGVHHLILRFCSLLFLLLFLLLWLNKLFYHLWNWQRIH